MPTVKRLTGNPANVNLVVLRSVALQPLPARHSMTSAPDLEPQILLFAPYCGGVAYRHLLLPAVSQLLLGEWRGERPLADGRSHAFVLSWRGEPAPLEPHHCTLEFPQLPEIGYSFTIPGYELVYWLMQRHEGQLPETFWRWLLTGEQPAAADAGG
jgi:hypothetical protein